MIRHIFKRLFLLSKLKRALLRRTSFGKRMSERQMNICRLEDNELWTEFSGKKAQRRLVSCGRHCCAVFS